MVIEEEQWAGIHKQKNDVMNECNRADEHLPLKRACEIRLKKNEVENIIAQQQMKTCKVVLQKNEVEKIIAQQQ